MKIKRLSEKERASYNQVVNHPLQSWEWGEFRKKTGVRVIRVGSFKKNTLIRAYQLTIHPLPLTKYKIGYFPKGPEIDKPMIEILTKIGSKNNCIFIKIEPNVKTTTQKVKIASEKLVSSPRPLFPKYTFQIDLERSEEELLREMKSKTRYNIRLAQRHGIKIVEDNSQKAFEVYLKLLMETTKRQRFYAHNEKYHRLMWKILSSSNIAHLLIAYYQPPETSYQLPLVAWVLFLFNKVVYYPYGGSSSKYRNVMASNLMMWEAIKWAKNRGAKTFDMWGSLGPNPNKNDPWYGFHRFKAGFGGKLVEFIGSYDLVLKPSLYHLYNHLDNLRWFILNLRSRFFKTPKM